jgi:pyridoxal phosphate enzyme (YggS family)
MIDSKALFANLVAVQERIAKAAHSAGRDPSEIKLVVVTKGHEAAAIEALYSAGVRDIGESYLNEALQKQSELGERPMLAWHMIGHVQSRKARDVAENFDLVHSVDSLKLANRLDCLAAASGTKLPILLECNVSGEESKHGWQVNGTSLAAMAEIEQVIVLPNLAVRGLMSMAPFAEDPQIARPYFERTRLIRDGLQQRFPDAALAELSMGMSGDFEAAILEGATIVRVGTAILGARD